MFHLKYFKPHIFAPPIFRACHTGNIDKLRRLLSKGVNANIRENDGLTPLMVAALRGKKAAVKILIEHGANVNTWDNAGNTPLIFASMNTSRWIQGFQMYHNYWMSRPAYPDPSQNEFINIQYSETDQDQYTGVARKLINAGADVNAISTQYWTPLMYSAFSGNNKMTELLLLNGAKIEARNSDGLTPLMLAVLRDKSSAVSILIEHGADVNAEDRDGDDVMLIASYKKNAHIIQLLKDCGAKSEVTICRRKSK